MNITYVRSPFDGNLEPRDWRHSLVMTVCPQPACLFHVIAVSLDAANAGLWDHTVAVHIGGERAQVP